jgi:hypothetical protein
VGYPVNHADDVYRVLNPKARHIIESRDVVWLGKSYGEWIKSKIDSEDKKHDYDE